MSGPLPVGPALPDWTARPRPPRDPLVGRYCRVEPLRPEHHADSLFAANSADSDGSGWTYLPYGPFTDASAYREWLERAAQPEDPLFFAVVLPDQGAAGLASYNRIEPAIGVIEVGHIRYAPVLQRTRAGTEAMYLMMKRVFDELGYRRYEWKCDALNAASRRAADRLGFSYEGTFRQAKIYKGRSRDTAWYSIIDADWPRIRHALEAWLDPSNFDARGMQKRALQAEIRQSTA